MVSLALILYEKRDEWSDSQSFENEMKIHLFFLEKKKEEATINCSRVHLRNCSNRLSSSAKII